MKVAVAMLSRGLILRGFTQTFKDEALCLGDYVVARRLRRYRCQHLCRADVLHLLNPFTHPRA